MDYRKNASSKRVEKENSPPATMGIFLGMWKFERPPNSECFPFTFGWWALPLGLCCSQRASHFVAALG